jgi:uncharacterized protein with HEPN domain
MAQLTRTDLSTAQRFTDHRKIIGLRNQLIHGYGVVDSRITWDVVENKLPVLIDELKRALP